MANVRMITIKGKWDFGRVLDYHVDKSEFLGYDEFGHPQYDTKRTELGELVYRLKYCNDKKVLKEIVDIICNSSKFKTIEVIIPVPPSKLRPYQPVIEIAQGLGKKLGIPVYTDVIVKVKNTKELKNLSTFEEKYAILKDAYKIENNKVKGKTILLLDDLYQSGATLNVITELLYKKAFVFKVKVLALTKTRRT